MKKYIVPQNLDGVPIGHFIEKEFSKGYLKSVIRKKAVRVNGEKVTLDYVLEAGDEVEFFLKFEPLKRVEIDVIFENEDFFVINKPYGVAVHAGEGVKEKEALTSILGEKFGKYYLVHRLDLNTSGALIVAKNPESQEVFKKMFRDGKITKEYLALVLGSLKKGVIDDKLEGRKGQEVEAKTFYDPISQYPDDGVSYLTVRIEHGRFHQIRKHFSMIKHPIAGDQKYGEYDANRLLAKKFGLKRQFLHASRVYFGWKGEHMSIKAYLPADLEKVISQLNKSKKKAKNEGIFE
jgi:23S rRNA pseudouridine955/2504/2580 synthase